ncbi:TOG array regulator of axonemal microtubules protein 2-like [Anabrus simplex]|uniref:TOG array regulator of axonemal microtubules protein 2-like n=1 Tax=Anabrus simplex TaxID=316456 RepID=UPI0034DDBD70
MVTFIPTFHSVRALVEKGSGHKNPLVRSATARLLTCIAVLAGPDVILGPYGNKDTRRRMLATMAQLLADGNVNTRQFAKQLFRTLMNHEDFDTLLNQEVSRPMIARIEKLMCMLRHQEENEMK